MNRKTTLPVCLLLIAIAAPAPAQQSTTLTASDGTSVTIARDVYGVPHILARSELGVLFGQGYATAADRLVQMELNRRQSEGRLAELFGVSYLAGDIDTRSELYTAADRRRIAANMTPEWRARYQAFADGVNRYIDSMNADPGRLMPQQIAQAQMLGLTLEPWTVESSLAIVQYITGSLGRFGGAELDRLEELASYGEESFEQMNPLNDKRVYTTIAPGDGPGIPQLPPAPTRINARQRGLHVSGDVSTRVDSMHIRVIESARRAGAAVKLGSFALVIDSSASASGNPLLLGCPQMARPVASLDETNIVCEIELDAPGLHVAGMSIPGVPYVIIGRTENLAWTMTSGVSDNCDVFIDSASSDLTKYWYNGEWRDVEVIHDTVIAQRVAYPITFLRTVHGPVIAIDTAARQLIARTTTYREREQQIAEAVVSMSKAASIDEFEAGVRLIPCSFNVLYAGRDGRVGYWHAGIYPLPDSNVDRRLPRIGDGSMDWKGFMRFEDLPQCRTSSRGYFANFNNKPAEWWDNGDNVPWTSTSWFGTLVDSLASVSATMSPRDFAALQDVPRRIDAHGTYEEAIELSPSSITGRNVLAPGQSGFVSISGSADPHSFDQWPLFQAWRMKDQLFGFASGITGEGDVETQCALSFIPNPTLGEVRLLLGAAPAGTVRAEVFDALGCRIALVTGNAAGGPCELRWNGLGPNGSPVPPGIYLVRVETLARVVAGTVVVGR